MSRIYLIGPRGSGKTTVGKLLADKLAFAFRDLDLHLCQREGCSVADIVSRLGWAGFRKKEAQALLETGVDSDIVLATGGGIILSGENRKFLRDNGTVIWLKASLPALVERLGKDLQAAQRPSLTGANPVQEIEQIMKERESLYCEAAHHIVDGDAAPDKVCEEIAALLK